jgi:DNA mismatch repair ATPase MutS
MLHIRKGNTPKSQKKPQVVNREVCSIMTLGTRTFCSLDVKLQAAAAAALEENGSSSSQDDQCGGPLLVIREVLLPSSSSSSGNSNNNNNGDQNDDQDYDQDDDDDDSTDGGVQPVCEYGITLIDAIRGTVTLGMFADDVLRNRMRTLLISFHPSEILIQGKSSSNDNDDDDDDDENDGNGTSKELLSLLKSYQNETRTPCSIEIINQNESYPKSTALNKEHARNLERNSSVRPWNVNETLQELHRRKYYPRSSRKQKSNTNTNDVSRWPIVLKMVVEGGANLCLSSFGAALFYLQRNLIDREILSMNIVRAYIPAAVTVSSAQHTQQTQQTQQIQSQSQSQSQQSQYDNDGDAKMMIPAAAAAAASTSPTRAAITTTTTNIDDFWTSQQQQQQQQQEGPNGNAAVTQESLLDGLEENPLYKIPTATPQPQPQQQQQQPSAAAAAAAAAAADNNGEDTITHMSLDGTTLHNLEILTNAVDYKIVGSLWSKLNYTKSPHGSRMLRAWLLRPLFRKNEIERRGDAVEELIRGAGNLSLKEARDSVLNKIGDLDRLLNRVHSMSVGVSSGGGSPADDDDDDDIISNEYHPNERAVLYEGKTYTKRKVLDFKNLLKGLQKACQLPEIFSDIDLDPNGFVFKLVRLQKDGGLFPDMVESLDWFMDNFDCEKAASGEFVPSRGTDPIYDQACDNVNQVKEDLENYKQEMIQDHLKPRHVAQRSWKYANIKPDSKDKYLIELPVNVEVPHDFHVKGKRGTGQKQINKYQTPVVVDLVKELEQAYEIQQTRKAKGMQIIFAKFDTQRPLWAAAAQATAILDALGSLAIMAGNPGYCRAEILDCSAHQQPSINIVQGRHPVVENTFHSSDFIPNDLQLGPNPNEMDDDNTENGDNGNSARLLLLSGEFFFLKVM